MLHSMLTMMLQMAMIGLAAVSWTPAVNAAEGTPSPAATKQMTTQSPTTKTKTTRNAAAPSKYTVIQQRPDRVVAVLPNRMIVVAQSAPAEPVVSVQAWVKTGSIYEQEHVGAGLSHFLEHLLASGTTTTRSEAQSNVILGRIGAQTNAATSLANVHYYINTTSDHADEAIGLLSDWIQNAKITPEEYQRERQVIQKEFSMDEGEPGRIFWKLTQQARYKAHPARYPTIGYLDEFLKVTRPQIIDFYHRMYVPNNMVFVVAGDIDPTKVVERVAGLWDDAPAKALPKLSFPVEPEIESPRSLSGHADISQPRLRLAWPGTKLGGEGDYAMDLLASVLGQGELSRLVQSARDQKGLVTNISAFNLSFSWGRGFFAVDSQVAAPRGVSASADMATKVATPKEQIQKVKEAVLKEIARLRDEPVSEEELARAKRKVLANVTLAGQTVQGLASQLAQNTISMGDPDYLAKYAQAIQKLTPADLQKAAQHYLVPDHLITVTLLPQPPGTPFKPLARPTPVSAKVAHQFKHVPVKLDNRQLIDELKEKTRKPHEQTPVVSVGKVKEFTLDNGLRVVVQRSTVVPGAAMQLYWKGGLLGTPTDKLGIANAMARMMLRGTTTKSAKEINTLIESLGASLGAGSGNSTTFVRASCLAGDWPEMMSLLADVSLHPSFPADQWRQMQPRLLAAIHRQRDTWSGELGEDFRKVYFDGHPWSATPLGEAEAVKKLTPADLQQYHDEHLGASVAVLAVVGDVEPEQVKEQAQALFGGMPAKPQAAFEPPMPKAPRAQAVQFSTDKPVAAVQIGFGPGLVRSNPDYARLQVLSTTMSDFPSGWLEQQLRGKGPGLVYAVGAWVQTGLAPGYFAVLFNTQPSQAVEAIGRTMKVVQRAKHGPISAEDLERAKAKVLTREFLGRQSNANRAAELALDELYGVNDPYAKRFLKEVKAMDADTLKKMAAKYLRDPVAVVVTSKPIDKAKLDAAVKGESHG